MSDKDITNKESRGWGGGWGKLLGGPVVKTLHFQCRECGFDPWLEN